MTYAQHWPRPLEENQQRNIKKGEAVNSPRSTQSAGDSTKQFHGEPASDHVYGGAPVKDRHVVNWAESRKSLLEKEEGRGEPRAAPAWPE